MGRTLKPRLQPHERPTKEVTIESVDLEAQGICRQDDGKVMFVRGAITGELVRAAVVRSKPTFEVAETVEILKSASIRVSPRCKHFGICGGCSMQHVEATAQLAIKQRALEDCLFHIAKLKAEQVLPPIAGPTWGYRYRARLSVRNVVKKGGVLVGFHERASSYIADMRECHILPSAVAKLLLALRELVGALSVRDQLPQIELAVGNKNSEEGFIPSLKTEQLHEEIILVLRILQPLTEQDHVLLDAFEAQHHVNFWLQPKGPDTAAPRKTSKPGDLHYTLPQFNIKMPFRPTDFTQVNPHINRALVGHAISLLEVQAKERILDLFCGLGNFTLPLATLAAQVQGIEGSQSLVSRALENARLNKLEDKTAFLESNLFEVDSEQMKTWGQFDRWLIDPPREGALAVVKALGVIDEIRFKPKRIVYVSCNPSTLARDAAILVYQAGYILSKAGIINMFPHTSHIESVAVFDLPDSVKK
ncbi:MAG: 23S rRNA (uracil(1939)-C(5))-methyltransferase RlmD [Burkholderiaceae bacterium]|nr:23S rRNA (uracil(1939)-C(5))-methyltransferase RlmD [Burkholderiaceae bacterium]